MGRLELCYLYIDLWHLLSTLFLWYWHPLAHALLQEAQRRELTLLEPAQVTTVSGQGLVGELEGWPEPIRVGRPDWLESFDVAVSDEARTWLAQADGSVVAVAHGRALLGLVQIEDQLRADVEPALDGLGQQLGFEAVDLGWQMLPEQKLQRLERLRQQERVAMVGDGINDAPALAAADLGIAIGTGTQIAQDSAGMVLMGDRLDNLPEALTLARRTLAKVRQNLFWAFGYNLIVLPLAAGALLPSQGVLLSPPLAALLMAISSITVVLNALLLRVP